MRLSGETADTIYDQIAACLPQPAFRPRALFERFGIEVLSTTESVLNDLHWHNMTRDSDWSGNVVTTYRPDAVVDPEFDGFANNIERLGVSPVRMRRHGQDIWRRIANGGRFLRPLAPRPAIMATPPPEQRIYHKT